MILSDIQPHYFPRLHYFARMLQSCIFVLRDDVQFVRNHRFPGGSRGPSCQAHTPVRTASGSVLLAVSVHKTGLRSIAETEISSDQPWAKKHLNVLKNSYFRSLNGRRLLPELESILSDDLRQLGHLNTTTIYWALAHILGIDSVDPTRLSETRINALLQEVRRVPLNSVIRGSQLECLQPAEGDTATDRIVALCEHYQARQYVAGRTAVEAYLDRQAFAAKNIELLIQDWHCPDYPQGSNGFIPNLSIIDLLMNVPLYRVIDYLSPQGAV